MVLRALSYLVRHGPQSDQDRWEDPPASTPSHSPHALRPWSARRHLPADARELALDIADSWEFAPRGLDRRARHAARAKVRNTGLLRARRPLQAISDRGALDKILTLRNLAFDPGLPAAAQFGVDFLQLVRFGLRRPDYPHILGSLRLADALLKVDTPSGPSWRRYFDDGYGEHDDGSEYDGVGRGRPWPLLTGERAHYEIASGRDPLPLMDAMARMASPGGMLPEQIWDAPSIPERGLQFGQATGSAMPLAWTHAEFVKLVASRALQRPFDRPEAVRRRYRGDRPVAQRAIWAPTRRSAT